MKCVKHLIDDFEADRGEDDLTHMPEILRLYDLSRCPPFTREQHEEAVRRNQAHRYLHHHVFDTGLVRQILEYCGFAVKKLTEQFPNHIVALARKESH